MTREFKLKGTPEANFKALEKILPRVFKRLNTKTYGILPSSILHTFTPSINEDGLIFSCCLFKGKLKKIAFNIGSISGKEAPTYHCIIKRNGEEKKIFFSTRKLNHIQEINEAISDGDFVELYQILPEDKDAPILTNIHISVLLILDQNYNETQEFITNELLKEEEYEGI